MSFEEALNLDGPQKLQCVGLSLDLAQMRQDGETMTKNEFSEDRFDRVYMEMLRQSEAGTLSMTLDFNGASLKIIVTEEEGITFENFRYWLAEQYAKRVPVDVERRVRARARARRKAHRECDDPTKAEEITRACKMIFWRHTPRIFVQEVESS